MSNANTPSFPDFGKLVPGFDFLQNLTKPAAGGATPGLPQLPGLGGWIAPTLNVEELDKRIQELKSVQFWLDQNAAALKATTQALELQKMTLATLKGMNFNMADMANAFKLKIGDGSASGAGTPGRGDASDGGDTKDMKDKPKPTFAGLEIPPSAFQLGKPQPQADEKPALPEAKPEAAPAPAGVVDPMQWWGALTQQFQTIATEAMKEVARTASLDGPKNMAAGLAKGAVKNATDMATGIAKGIADTASRTMAGGARAAMKNVVGNNSNWPKPPAAAKAASRTSRAAGAPSASPASRPTAKTTPKATRGAAGRKTPR